MASRAHIRRAIALLLSLFWATEDERNTEKEVLLISLSHTTDAGKARSLNTT